MNTQHNTEFFQQSIFIINDRTNSDAPVTEETSLELFLREFCEGDPARAWYVEASERYAWRDRDGKPEMEYTHLSDAVREIREMDEIDERGWMHEKTVWEVRERDNGRMGGSRLIDTFDSEVEANEYHLNGLYWNYCNLSFDAPFHVDTREECEAEINERKLTA